MSGQGKKKIIDTHFHFDAMQKHCWKVRWQELKISAIPIPT
jgi:hypothetical protein